MSATREHRNAGLIEQKITTAWCALDEAGGLLDELAAFLPDEYPMPAVRAALDEAVKAVENLQGAQE